MNDNAFPPYSIGRPLPAHYESREGDEIPAPVERDEHAIDLLIHERPRILRVKLVVLATEIQERLQIRARNLDSIAAESLTASNQLIPFDEWSPGSSLPPESTRLFWVERLGKLQTEARQQDIECWRDVALAMNEFLTVWEGVEQSSVRARFLREQQDEAAL